MSHGFVGAEPRPGYPRQPSSPILTPGAAPGAGIPKTPSNDDGGAAGSPSVNGSGSSGSGRGPLFVAGRSGGPTSSLLAAALRAPPPPPTGAEHPTSASAFMAALKASAAPATPANPAPSPSPSPSQNLNPASTPAPAPGSPTVPHAILSSTAGTPAVNVLTASGSSLAPMQDDDSDEEETKPAEKPQQAGLSQADKRKLVLLEIVNTERDYLNDLDLMVDMFMKPVTERALLKPMEIATIFSNLQELIGINKEFLKLLENSRADVGADLPAMRVAEDFSRMVEPFKRYGRYFADQAFALATLEKCQATIPAFGAFVNECLANPRARGLSFFAFLIKPVQRICKYPLLLRELIKTTTENHPDYQSLLEAAKDIEALVAMLNEKKRATETHQKVLELMTSVEALDQQPAFLKGSSSRYFIFEAEMKIGLGKKGQKHKCYLFNDVLLYHSVKERHKEGKRFEFGGVVPINQYSRAVDVADSAEDSNVFAIRHAEGTVTFVTNSLEDKKKWMKEVKNRIGDTIKRDLKSKADDRSATPTRNGPPGRNNTPDRLTSSTPTLGSSVVDMLFSAPVSTSPPAAAPNAGKSAAHTWSGTSSSKDKADPPAVVVGTTAPKQVQKSESWMDALASTNQGSPSPTPALSSPIPSSGSGALGNSGGNPTGGLALSGSGSGFSSAAFSSPRAPGSPSPLPSPKPEVLPSQPSSGSSLPPAFYASGKPFARGLSQPNFRTGTPTPPAERSPPVTTAAAVPAIPGAPSFLLGMSSSPPAANSSSPAVASNSPADPPSPVSREGSGAGLLLYTPAGIVGSGTPGGTPNAGTPVGRGTPTTPGERQTAAALMASLGFPAGAKTKLRGSVDPGEAASMLGAAPSPPVNPAPTPNPSPPSNPNPSPPSATNMHPPSGGAIATAHTGHAVGSARDYPSQPPPPVPTSAPATVPVTAPAVATPPAVQPIVASPPTQGSPPLGVNTTPVYNPAYPAPANTPPPAVKAGVAKQLVTVVKQPVAKQQVGSIAPKK